MIFFVKGAAFGGGNICNMDICSMCNSKCSQLVTAQTNSKTNISSLGYWRGFFLKEPLQENLHINCFHNMSNHPKFVLLV